MLRAVAGARLSLAAAELGDAHSVAVLFEQPRVLRVAVWLLRRALDKPPARPWPS
jgi:hypothetical protein